MVAVDALIYHGIPKAQYEREAGHDGCSTNNERMTRAVAGGPRKRRFTRPRESAGRAGKGAVQKSGARIAGPRPQYPPNQPFYDP
jgi:hypothetical protein